MAGTVKGGAKAAATNKAKYGEDFYQRMGRIGGKKAAPESRWWYRHPELAKKYGAIGGSISKRGKAKSSKKERE